MKKSVHASNQAHPPFKKRPKESSPHGSKNGAAKRSSLESIKAREAAFLALFRSLKEQGYLLDFLEKWQLEANPSELDFKFAQEIAFGAARMALALDELARQLTPSRKLNLKLKEKALLRCAMYQHFYMDKVPLYAIADETTAIAKKHLSQISAKFFNALIRRLEKETPALPLGNSLQELSLRFSYPLFFVAQLVKELGLEKSVAIFKLGNERPVVMVRDRAKHTMFTVTSPEISEISKSPNFYIQNATPVALFDTLAKKNPFKPNKILDLCASPGGKLLLAHDTFKEAKLYANDVSEEKLKTLLENCQKYGVAASLFKGPGEEFVGKDKFDLIILDVPCSNTGVLNKRPEARWRLSKENLSSLTQKAETLFSHALTLLEKGGRVWYMTCSILREENENFAAKMAGKFGLEILHEQLIFPNSEGFDGGYAAELRRAT